MSEGEVRILFFASLRDRVGRDGFSLEIAAPTGLADVLGMVRERVSDEAYTALTGESVRIAINQELITVSGAGCSGECSLNPGDELAFLPPVTGG